MTGLHKDLRQALQSLLGARFSDAPSLREQHGRGESWQPVQAPDAVVWPKSADEVSAIVRACSATRTPIIGFGAGTSLEGHVLAPQGGVCVDFTRMNRIIAVNLEDMDCRVEPGVTREQLNAHLRDSGLFFSVDPGANATLGGMASTRASGTNAVRYGTMRDNVLTLQVVTAEGRTLNTGTRARKSSAGYDLTRLFVGSEGTLGLITELTLRLHPQPEAVSVARVAFANVEAAVQCVVQVMQCGLPMARIELLDALTVGAINAYSQLDLPTQPTLFLEFHGSQTGVAEQAELLGQLAAELGGSAFAWAQQQEERNRLWAARHAALYAILAQRPGAKAWISDVCVPMSQLARCIAETREDLEAGSLYAPIVGHVGDGNFHVVFVIDPDNAGELAEAKRLNERMVQRAIALGGTCTGEHGVGNGKLAYLRQELGDSVDLMRAIKLALDPDNLFNPGKTVWA